MKRPFLILLFLCLVAAIVYFFYPQKQRPEFDQAAVAGQADVTAPARPTAQVEIAGGWNRFRGPNGTGVSLEKNIPLTWSDTENLAWKTKLPGWGASSPVLTDRHVFLTAYSGYGTDDGGQGDTGDLQRHVVCIAREDGAIVWSRDYETTAVEDPYRGPGLNQHGYATNSCVTDGERVFAFLGKSGVVALDLEGNELWATTVGTGSSNRQWGSAASLMMFRDLVIVNASEESQTLYALAADTGAVVWEAESEMLELCFSTPVIAPRDGGEEELLLVVPNEVWGLNPANGKTKWYAEIPLGGNISPGITVDEGTAYAFGGYQRSGSVAIDLETQEVANQKDVRWSAQATSYVPTPVLLDGQFHWINGKGIYHCSSAATGDLLFRSRVDQVGGSGTKIYASPIAIDGKIFAQTRQSGVIVIEPADELKVVAQNQFASDTSIFNATPAVDNGQLLLRSDQFLYCVEDMTK